MNWTLLQSEAALQDIKQHSFNQPVVIFKHSTRCSISATALNRLERNWNDQEMNGVQAYYLDLLNYRPISNQIAQEFGIAHESPQLLLIANGKCVYHTSHMGITYADLRKQLSNLTLA